MTAFMGDTPLIDAPVELRPGGMDTLVDAVAAFDGQSYGIGYSVYSYVAGMYNAYDGVKILKIDGVEPSFATIADGTYPCTGYNYAVIRADEKEASPARLLLEYILTDEGQAAIAQTGYFAPLAPTSGIDITIKDLGLMTTTGTGKETCNSELWYNYAKPLTKEMQFGDNIINVPVTNNEKLDAEVTEFVRENAEKFLAENGNKYYFRCDSVLFNGYLSVTLHTQSLHTQSSENFGAVWDIPSGRRLSLSDLFTKGSEFVSYLNIKIDQRIETTPIYEEKVVLKKPFVGLTADFDNFSVGGDYYRFSSDDAGDLFLYFNEGDNDYFGNSFYVQIKVYGMDNCLMKERRDMSSYVNEQKTGWFRHSVGEIKQSVEKVNDECWGYNIHFHTDRLIYSVIDEKYGGAEKINADIRAYIDAHPDLPYYCFSDEGIENGLEFWKEFLIDTYGIADPTTEDFKKHCLLKSETTLYAVAKEYGEDYVAIHYFILAEQGEVYYGIGAVYDEKTVWYDLSTGEKVDEKDVPLE